MDLDLRRRMMMSSGNYKTYTLVNYSTDGTSSTAINTGLQLFKMNWWSLNVTFTLQSTFSTDFQTVVRCQRDASPYDGLVIGGDGGSSTKRTHLVVGNENDTGESQQYLSVSTSKTYTITAEWYADVGGYQQLSDGSTSKLVRINSDIDLNTPFTIGGSWASSSESWRDGRFPKMTITSLTLNYSPVLENPYNYYSLYNYTLTGTNTFIDTGINLFGGDYSEIHIGATYYYTSRPDALATLINCTDESNSSYPGFCVRVYQPSGTYRRPECGKSIGSSNVRPSRNLSYGSDQLVKFMLHYGTSGNVVNNVRVEYSSTAGTDLGFTGNISHNKPLTIGGIYDDSGNIARTTSNCVINSLKVMYK